MPVSNHLYSFGIELVLLHILLYDISAYYFKRPFYRIYFINEPYCESSGAETTCLS